MKRDDPHNEFERDEANASLEALLDEALAPPDAPADLTRRIVAATGEALAQRANADAPAVVGRLGWRPWSLSAAAALVAACIGLAVMMQSGDAVNPAGGEAMTAASIEEAFAALSDHDASLDSEIDREMQLLRLDVDAMLAESSELNDALLDDSLRELEMHWAMEAEF